MSIRPVATRWFEILVLKKDLNAALECLAGTGAVQLQTRTEAATAWAGVAEGGAEFDKLAARYRAWWPTPANWSGSRFSDLGADPGQRLGEALNVVHAWAHEADGTIGSVQTEMRERDSLATLRRLLSAPQEALPDWPKFVHAGPLLKSEVFQVPAGTMTPEESEDLITARIPDGEGAFLLVLGEAGAVNSLASALISQKCQPLNIPASLPAKREDALEWIEARIQTLDGSIRSATGKLHALSDKHGLAVTLGRIRQIKWLAGIVPDVGQTQRLAWITGWTNDATGARIEKAMGDCGIHHFIAHPPPPPGANAPVVLTNPPWSRPFEMLTRMLGMPAAGDADPSSVVAIIGPLLFGFMFGDIGQGLVLLLVGLALRGKYPVLGVLVSGGIMSMVFGALFGSVFAREDIVSALWFHPLDHPIELLLISVGAGAAILLTGLLLEALQMHWHGHAGEFWRGHAGLLVAYCGMLAIAFAGWLGVLVMVAGIVWFVAGAGLEPGWRKGAIAIGEMVEALFQLAVNTLSFARVGAFALAHAGLSIAVTSLADAAGPIGYWPVLVLGNAFVIGLEGLVVSIQTTRLVLFEFFIRFLHAGGREFRPLQPPQVNHSGLAEGEQ